MPVFTIYPSGERPIRFTGELLAEVASQPNNGRPDYSGETGRWQELALYRTAKGTLIVVRTDRTSWANERDSVTVERGDQDAIIGYLGHDWLATDLYAAAGLDTAADIDE